MFLTNYLSGTVMVILRDPSSKDHGRFFPYPRKLCLIKDELDINNFEKLLFSIVVSVQSDFYISTVGRHI